MRILESTKARESEQSGNTKFEIAALYESDRRGLAKPQKFGYRPRSGLQILQNNAGVAKWQTRRIQNPVRVIPRVGSSPTSGTEKNQQKHW